MKAAGLDYEKVIGCTQNASRLNEAQAALNTTRAPMYSKLGPSPGLFPHIFIDAVPLMNNTWAALTKIICSKIVDAPLPVACGTRKLQLTFRLEGVKASSLPKASLEKAIHTAADFAVSALALPVRFEYPSWPKNQDPDPNGEPSYINVQALQGATAGRVSQREGGVELEVELSVLEAFATLTLGLGESTNKFARYLPWAMSCEGLARVPEGNVVDVRVTESTYE